MMFLVRSIQAMGSYVEPTRRRKNLRGNEVMIRPDEEDMEWLKPASVKKTQEKVLVGSSFIPGMTGLGMVMANQMHNFN